MNEISGIALALKQFANIGDNDFELSANCWKIIDYKKGDFYNRQMSVCKYLGFVVQGVFRSYIIDDNTAEEKNIFLYSSNQFVVSFKSFINQLPCDYYTVAMTDAKVVQIHITDLLKLYEKSHRWESFGRLLAQAAFNVAIERAESFLFQSPEERYLNLVKNHPHIFNSIPLYHISSYLGIQGPSLSRIRKRLSGK